MTRMQLRRFIDLLVVEADDGEVRDHLNAAIRILRQKAVQDLPAPNDEERALLPDSKIQAIKQYRERVGGFLVEAKDVIDAAIEGESR